MTDKKDASGLTKQERHDAIIAYLKSINKPTKVFHLRWRPGDLLDGKILRSTPMFWFMKYQWSRPQIEEMFFKARLEIDDAFDSSLQQVFGGSAGARWRGGVEIPKQKKWKQRAEENARAWQGQQTQQVSREHVGGAVTDLEATQLREHDHANLLKNKLAQPINGKQTEVWNAVSDFGADKAIDYRTFSDNLKDRGINVSPLLAKQLFDQLADPQGKITRPEMDAIVRQLDQVKLPSDFASISWDDMNGKLGAQLIMKRVLLAASAGEPFNVDDFVFASKFGVSIEPVQFLGKLTDRDVEWDDRVRAMEALSANLGTNPMFNNVLSGANLPELLCGWSTQLLDSKPEVQKTAVDLMPHIFHEALEKGDPKIAVGHLEEIMDNLFKIIDDPKSAQNHAATKAAVDKIVADIINLKDPEAVLYLAGVLSEKCDLENVTSAPARAYALEQIQKIMFGAETPIVSSAPAKTSKIDFLRSLPKKGTANREWLDIAAKKQTKPSNNMYAEEELYDNESGNLPPRNVRSQEHAPSGDPSFAGVGDDEFMEGVPLDPAGPYANVASFPTNAMVKQPVKFDASKSHDCDRQPVKKYVWNFGDGSPEETTTTPVTKHAYDKPQVYPVTVTVTDKYGKSARAGLSQRVNDPKRILPPYAALDSDPPTQHVRKPVKFDASKSHDGDGNPVVSYVFDFGDGSDPVSTPKPVVNHAYEKKGAYPVKVTVTDKHGQTASASLTQRIIDPQAQDPTLPYAAVHSTPKDPVPRQPVRLDASQSVDCDGDPCKNYVWDFGDFSPPVTTTKPVVNHAYEKPGTYPVKVTVTDKYGKPAHASCKTMVVPASQPASNHAQEHILPPTVLLKSRPRETVPQQPVYFDASDSHDYQGNPCVSFLWDFGDDSPKETTREPYTTHPYAECGTYPVTVVGTDKFKQTGDASVNQRVRQPGPEDPYAAVRSTPKDPLPSQPVRIDASESVDRNGDPCKNFVFDFGDGSPPLVSPTPVVNHAYDAPGSYPVSVTVTDRAGKKANASLTQRIKDPKQAPSIGPPTAILSSQPKDTFPFEVVDFDASKSHDADGMPCRSFLWDFGDGTPKETTPGPLTQHKYARVGSYPVVVQVTDKHGQKAHASVQQRVSPDVPYKGAKKITPNSKPAYAWLRPKKPVSNSASQDPLNKFRNVGKMEKTDPAYAQLIDSIAPPVAHLEGTPKVTTPNQLVDLDASRSHDFQGGPCVEFEFEFGDGTPNVTQQSPYVKHAYQQIGHYPASVTVADKWQQRAKAHCNQKVIDSDPSRNHRVDMIRPPEAHLTNDPPVSKPEQMVALDASKSKDMYDQPCVSFKWDFGDGSPQQTTTGPVTQHAFPAIGHYPVTVTVKDKNGLTANASVNQKVIDPMPSYQGNRSIAPVPDFGRSDPDELKDEPSYDRMDPIELGDEFRGITSEAISKALLDPNPQNSKKGKKLTDVMKQLNPQWPDEELDPDAKNRYNQMNFPMKPYAQKEEKKKIGIKGGKAELNVVDISLKMDFGSFEPPDI